MDEKQSLYEIFEKMKKEYSEIFVNKPTLSSARENLIKVLLNEFFSKEDFMKIYGVYKTNKLLNLNEKEEREKGVLYKFILPSEKEHKYNQRGLFYWKDQSDLEKIGRLDDRDFPKYTEGLIDLPERKHQIVVLNSPESYSQFLISRNRENSKTNVYRFETMDSECSYDLKLQRDGLMDVKTFHKLSLEELCDKECFDKFYDLLYQTSLKVFKAIQNKKGEIPKEQIIKDYEALKVLAKQ